MDPGSLPIFANADRRQSIETPDRRQGLRQRRVARLWLKDRGTKPVIPNRSNRKQPFSFNRRLYKERRRIENAFGRLKDFRRIATRYDRLARNFLASVCIVAALVW
jgi:transposase